MPQPRSSSNAVPAILLVAAAPVSIVVTMLLADLVLHSFNWPIHRPEMIASAIVNAIGGLLSTIPMLFSLRRADLSRQLQSALICLGLRMGLVFVGIFLTTRRGWGLEFEPVCYWALAFYFPMLIAETSVLAWILKRPGPTGAQPSAVPNGPVVRP